MIDWPLVSVIIFLPLIGALIILFIKEDELTSINIKWAALLATLGTVSYTHLTLPTIYSV